MIYPIGYGADPTGRQDSSDAILEALTDAFKLQTGLHMMPHVADLGGVVVDLPAITRTGNLSGSLPPAVEI